MPQVERNSNELMNEWILRKAIRVHVLADAYYFSLSLYRDMALVLIWKQLEAMQPQYCKLGSSPDGKVKGKNRLAYRLPCSTRAEVCAWLVVSNPPPPGFNHPPKIYYHGYDLGITICVDLLAEHINDNTIAVSATIFTCKLCTSIRLYKTKEHTSIESQVITIFHLKVMIWEVIVY